MKLRKFLINATDKQWAEVQQIGRPLFLEDDRLLSMYELNRNSVISGIFTSDLKEQQST